MIRLTYDGLDAGELQGGTQADYLVAVDAHLRVFDGDLVVYEEPCFPVLELARALKVWLDHPDRRDFEFESMSFEELGTVAIRMTGAGWRLGSAFSSAASSIIGWDEVERCVRAFVHAAERDLAALGVDPAEVLRT